MLTQEQVLDALDKEFGHIYTRTTLEDMVFPKEDNIVGGDSYDKGYDDALKDVKAAVNRL